MTKYCKFCGEPINSAETESCGKCTRYCMSKCKEALNSNTSWHSGICLTCKHNPYAIRHKWNGQKWVEQVA